MAELRGRLARPTSIWVKESSPARKRCTGRISIQPHVPTPSSRKTADTDAIGSSVSGWALIST